MANLSMLGGVMDKLANIISGFFAIIPQLMYFLYTSIGSLLDLFQFVFRKIAGLDVYYVNGAEKTGDFVIELIEGILGINKNYSALNTVFWSMVIFGVIVLIVMTILTIIKAHYNYDAKKSQPSYILKTTLKSLATMVIIPLTAMFGLYLGSVLFNALDTITTPVSESSLDDYYEREAIENFAHGTASKDGKRKVYSSYDMFGAKEWSNTPTFSGILFKVCVNNANRVRNGEYTVRSNAWDNAGVFFVENESMSQEAAKEKVSQQIDYAFSNTLSLVTSKTIELSGKNEAETAIASSLTFGPSAVFAAGLINVDHFSKFNVGLVWYYYNLWTFNYIVGFLAVAICLALFGNILFGLLVRFLVLSIMFLIYPPIVGITPFDEGNATKTWKKKFMSYILSAYTGVISINILFLIMPLIFSISFFNNAFLDEIFQMIVLIAGLSMVKRFISLVSGFVGAENIDEMGGAMKKESSKPVQKGIGNAVKVGAASISARQMVKSIKTDYKNSDMYARSAIKRQMAKRGDKIKRKDVTPEQIKKYRLQMAQKLKNKFDKTQAISAKFEKIGGIANKALESDIGKIIFSRFGIPVDSVLESEYTEVEKRDKDGNVVTDEKGNVVTEKVLFKKDKKGNILNGKDGKPIIIKKKKSGLKNIGDGIVDISNVAFKTVGEISGIKGLVSSQSSAINTGKEKLNDLAKAIGVQGKNKGGALFKTEKMKAEEEEEAALESSVLSFEVSPDESAKTLEKINELVKRIKS